MSSCFSSEWPHYQHQNIHDRTSFISNISDHSYVLSDNNRSHIMSSFNDSRLTKRKSRASKKSPVTILNADASNFRALVQQLTGRPNATAPTKLMAHKGPLNINFTQTNNKHDADLLDEGVGGSKVYPFGYSNCYKPYIKLKQRQEGIFEHGVMSSNIARSEPSFPPKFSEASPSNGMNWEEFDEIGVEKCLKELEWVPKSNVDNNGDL